MRKVKVGKYFVPLWLIVVVLVAGVGASAYYIWQTIITLTTRFEVKEFLETVSYPKQLSLYPGRKTEFNVTINNHANVNCTVSLTCSLDNLTYQNAYVIFHFRDEYRVIPGIQNLTAWLYVFSTAPPLNTTLTVNVHLRGIILEENVRVERIYDPEHNREENITVGEVLSVDIERLKSMLNKYEPLEAQLSRMGYKPKHIEKIKEVLQVYSSIDEIETYVLVIATISLSVTIAYLVIRKRKPKQEIKIETGSQPLKQM